MQSTGGEFLKVADVARALCLTPETVYGLLRSGALPAFRFARAGKRGTWRVRRADFADFVAHSAVPKNDEGPAGVPSLVQSSAEQGRHVRA
jgi:hypothetical protein